MKVPNSSDPYISVIIPSYNSIYTIKKTLEGLSKQSILSKILEIIIVDSSDDILTKEYLKTINESVIKIIYSGIRIMPAKQRNIGALIAKGKLLAFIDSDAFPENDWLYYIDEAYSNGCLVGGGSYLIEESQVANKMIIAQYYFEFGEFIPVGNRRQKKMVPACNLFCDKDLFLDLKGFPLIRASEDSLFGVIVNRFMALNFIPQAKVYHIFREKKKDSYKNLKLLGKYIILYRKAFYPNLYNSTLYLIISFPLIVFYKLCKVYFRTLMHGQNHFKNLNRAIIEYILCVIHWSFGVWQGIFSETKLIIPKLPELYNIKD